MIGTCPFCGSSFEGTQGEACEHFVLLGENSRIIRSSPGMEKLRSTWLRKGPELLETLADFNRKIRELADLFGFYNGPQFQSDDAQSLLSWEVEDGNLVGRLLDFLRDRGRCTHSENGRHEIIWDHPSSLSAFAAEVDSWTEADCREAVELGLVNAAAFLCPFCEEPIWPGAGEWKCDHYWGIFDPEMGGDPEGADEFLSAFGDARWRVEQCWDEAGIPNDDVEDIIGSAWAGSEDEGWKVADVLCSYWGEPDLGELDGVCGVYLHHVPHNDYTPSRYLMIESRELEKALIQNLTRVSAALDVELEKARGMKAQGISGSQESSQDSE